jgi:hypothetical protein
MSDDKEAKTAEDRTQSRSKENNKKLMLSLLNSIVNPNTTTLFAKSKQKRFRQKFLTKISQVLLTKIVVFIKGNRNREDSTYNCKHAEE